jgi:uncharacterized membrane-anchored protein YitT (DUF2179 family)
MIDKKKIIQNIILLVVGNLLLAFTTIAVLQAHDLSTGGVTGIALFLNKVTKLPTSLISIILNTIFFILGFFFLGKKFALNTLASSLLNPLFLWIFEHFSYESLQIENRILQVLLASFLIGLSIGLVMRSGGSTGGLDIPALMINKYLHIPVGFGVLFCDLASLLIQFTGDLTFEKFIEAFLMLLIYSKIIDYVLLYGNSKVEIKIMSQKKDEISKMILHELDRGLTFFHTKTGYLKEENDCIITVIDLRELPRFKQRINQIDSESFMVISNVSEVNGHGFSLAKKYKEEKND